jgi:hypothetical protein
MPEIFFFFPEIADWFALEGKEAEKRQACERDDDRGSEEHGSVKSSGDDTKEEDTDTEFHDICCQYIGPVCSKIILGSRRFVRDAELWGSRESSPS